MSEELMDIRAVARIYCTTPGSIRTALWKHRKEGSALRVPLPIPEPGELRWLKSTVDAHLAELKAKWAESNARAGAKPTRSQATRKSARRRKSMSRGPPQN